MNHGSTGGRSRVLGMRDTDRGFTSRRIARVDSGIDGLESLRVRRLALGSADSAKAAILPLSYLRRAGLGPVWLQQLKQGTVSGAVVHSVWTSPEYCHCNFTAMPDFDRDLAARWSAALLKMSYSHPRWRRLMDLEGLPAGYEALSGSSDRR